MVTLAAKRDILDEEVFSRSSSQLSPSNSILTYFLSFTPHPTGIG